MYVLLLSQTLKYFQKNKVLDSTRLKALAHLKINITQLMISVLERVEKMAGTGRKCW